MIVTVTLNPAVDKTYTTTMLLPGQVNRMASTHNIAGGKGINVTKILRQYEHDVAAIGFLGGYSGRFIEECVRNAGAECFFTHIKEETRSSINIIADNGYVTEVLEPGPYIQQEELEKLISQYESLISDCDLIVLSGSIPRGIPTDIYARLIRIAKEKSKRIILDSSGEALVHGVKEKPYMIKPNVKELEYLLGHKVKGLEEISKAALYLNKQGIEHVFVSMGDKGLLYVYQEKVYMAKAPSIAVKNTVGCGDSVVASFCMSVIMDNFAVMDNSIKMDNFIKKDNSIKKEWKKEAEEPEEVLKKAAAISAANATTKESAYIPKERVPEIYEDISCTMISES